MFKGCTVIVEVTFPFFENWMCSKFNLKCFVGCWKSKVIVNWTLLFFGLREEWIFLDYEKNEYVLIDIVVVKYLVFITVIKNGDYSLIKL